MEQKLWNLNHNQHLNATSYGGVLAAVFSPFRKNQHRKAVQNWKEQQQNQLIEAAVSAKKPNATASRKHCTMKSALSYPLLSCTC